MSPSTLRPAGRPAELLLVEDNYGDVLLVREAFRNAKISNNLAVANDGEQGLRMLRREGEFRAQARPDLVLLDLNLPRMDGRELLEVIKADIDLRTIPVIIMTSSKAEIDVLKSYQLHANGYIVKPVNFERLQEVVASLETFWFTVVVLAPPQVVERADAA